MSSSQKCWKTTILDSSLEFHGSTIEHVLLFSFFDIQGIVSVFLWTRCVNPKTVKRQMKYLPFLQGPCQLYDWGLNHWALNFVRFGRIFSKRVDSGCTMKMLWTLTQVVSLGSLRNGDETIPGKSTKHCFWHWRQCKRLLLLAQECPVCSQFTNGLSPTTVADSRSSQFIQHINLWENTGQKQIEFHHLSC